MKAGVTPAAVVDNYFLVPGLQFTPQLHQRAPPLLAM